MELFQLESLGHFRLARLPRDGWPRFVRYGLVEDFGNGQEMVWMVF